MRLLVFSTHLTWTCQWGCYMKNKTRKTTHICLPLRNSVLFNAPFAHDYPALVYALSTPKSIIQNNGCAAIILFTKFSKRAHFLDYRAQNDAPASLGIMIDLAYLEAQKLVLHVEVPLPKLTLHHRKRKCIPFRFMYIYIYIYMCAAPPSRDSAQVVRLF